MGHGYDLRKIKKEAGLTAQQAPQPNLVAALLRQLDDQNVIKVSWQGSEWPLVADRTLNTRVSRTPFELGVRFRSTVLAEQDVVSVGFMADVVDDFTPCLIVGQGIRLGIANLPSAPASYEWREVTVQMEELGNLFFLMCPSPEYAPGTVLPGLIACPRAE